MFFTPTYQQETLFHLQSTIPLHHFTTQSLHSSHSSTSIWSEIISFHHLCVGTFADSVAPLHTSIKENPHQYSEVVLTCFLDCTFTLSFLIAFKIKKHTDLTTRNLSNKIKCWDSALNASVILLFTKNIFISVEWTQTITLGTVCGLSTDSQYSIDHVL